MIVLASFCNTEVLTSVANEAKRATNDYYGVGFYDSLHTILLPVKSFSVSSLLNYPAVADAFRQSNVTMSSICLVQLCKCLHTQMPPGWWDNWQADGHCLKVEMTSQIEKGVLGCWSDSRQLEITVARDLYLIISLVFGTDLYYTVTFWVMDKKVGISWIKV